MSYIQWQVRKAGKSYGPGMSENTDLASPFPFDEWVGDHLPDDFEGDVIRRNVFDYDRGPDGWVPHISQKQYTEMYGGPNN